MTITINVPVFPLRKEIAARKRRLGLSLGFSRGPRDAAAGKASGGKCGSAAAGPEPRYTAEGLEFDVSGMAGAPRKKS
ncbi:hypothetical protein EZH22_04355 [Xanthobacter dioxanivorans]|uniref:Uncharacterized protein n=1 Tax=Xanthobacter dioxanivorans TaxID=2528964 RepID=A0A974PQ05_9HYPH|nr:hypothetical protein [Xanthobacter dioxanivorans]QRG07634.1 hypothetical protein EZH22_04355 [Xanthobacter dioxanivorans]